ncbi:MAG: H+transporting two-sector ATPase subunit [bacterium]|nr:H+transporting two-sector ATPase subunit [bacterium]
MFVATLLIAAPEEASPPLIDIDGTLFVQFGFFIIMLIVLSRFLFRPYLQMRDRRRQGIEGAREEASEMQERAQQTSADYDARLTKARLRGAEERARLRGEGAIYERQVLGAARDESQKVLEAARAKIGADAGAAREKLTNESTTLARQIAKKILGREVA